MMNLVSINHKMTEIFHIYYKIQLIDLNNITVLVKRLFKLNMAKNKTDFSDIAKLTAWRRMRRNSHVERGKLQTQSPPKIKQKLNYDVTNVESKHDFCFDLNQIDQALEDVLCKYGNGNVEKHILRIFSEYDDKDYRERINELRKIIERLKTRISPRKDHPNIIMILRKILRSKEKILDEILGSHSSTPPSSDDEDEVEFVHVLPGSPTRAPNSSDDEKEDSLSHCSYQTFTLLSPQQYISEKHKILKLHDANPLLGQEPKPFKKIEKADQVTFWKTSAKTQRSKKYKSR